MLYKLMRGMCKTLTARRFLWFFVRIVKRRDFKAHLKIIDGMPPSIFQALRCEDYVKFIRRNGAVVGPSLPEEMLVELLSYAEKSECYADRVETHGFMLKDYETMCEKLNKRILLAQYLNVAELPLIHKLANDSVVLEIAAKYLQVKPKLVDVNLWWTFPEVNASEEDKSKHAHVFHYDLDDIKFIKFFFYITDVTTLDGPHVYVEGSNVDIKYKNNVVKSKRFTDDEITAAYGEEAVKTVTGPAGTCLIEDTITLHKGMTPVKNPRLILQLQFSIFDYGQANAL